MPTVGFSQAMICQHLDDICAAAEAKGELDAFDAAFMEAAKELGVKLAPRDDCDKTFAPCRRGVVFGVEYDRAEWTWQLPEEKKVRIVAAIREVSGRETVTDKQAQSLAGKLINIKLLIPAGKFNVDRVMVLLADSSRSKTVRVSDDCKRQLRFWELAMLACNCRLSIPNLEVRLLAWAVDIYSTLTPPAAHSISRGEALGGCVARSGSTCLGRHG